MDPSTVRWLVFLAVAAVALFFAGRNLYQVWILRRRHVPLDHAESFVDQTVALSGRFHLVEGVRLGHIPCVYYESVTQEYVSRGDTGGWRTVAKRSDFATCGVASKDRFVLLADVPTEVHGTQKTTLRGYTGFWEWFRGERDSREIRRWLPIPRGATVVGRLRREGALVLRRDPVAGLLLSPRRVQDVVLRESLKALAFLSVLPLAYWFLFHYAPRLR
ncbi:MAG: hypothetical protein D6731_16275 [Planctomycetota bacterium]|nr:MAG: hypothetical protein D6731_16275 [Planctomycetota bacterium]